MRRLFVTGWKTLLKRNWWVNYYQLEERSPKAALRTCVWFSGSCIERVISSTYFTVSYETTKGARGEAELWCLPCNCCCCCSVTELCATFLWRNSFATTWTVAYQVPPSMGLSWQKIPEWVSSSSSRASSQPRGRMYISYTGRQFFSTEPPGSSANN